MICSGLSVRSFRLPLNRRHRDDDFFDEMEIFLREIGLIDMNEKRDLRSGSLPVHTLDPDIVRFPVGQRFANRIGDAAVLRLEGVEVPSASAQKIRHPFSQ